MSYFASIFHQMQFLCAASDLCKYQPEMAVCF